jgi:hypothetical protein
VNNKKNRKGYCVGHLTSEEVRCKISKANTGRKHTEEAKKKIGLYWKGRKRGKQTPEHRKKLSIAFTGRVVSEETKKKMSLAKAGKNSPSWKGDSAGYRSKHGWMSRKFGKPDTCEHCKQSGLSGREIHWANVSGNYLREKSDWLRLCIRCHGAFDRQNGSRRRNIIKIKKQI